MEGFDVRTDTLFKEKTVFSYEIFPPKKTAPIDTIYHTLERLKGQKPDFISVTLGAGGSKDKLSTADIAQKIQEEQFLPSVAHLPAVNFSKEEVVAILNELKEKRLKIF